VDVSGWTHKAIDGVRFMTKLILIGFFVGLAVVVVRMAH
jgi:hypothetical protein